MAQYPEVYIKLKLCQLTFKHNRRGLEINDLGNISGQILRNLRVGFWVEYDQNTLQYLNKLKLLF